MRAAVGAVRPVGPGSRWSVAGQQANALQRACQRTPTETGSRISAVVRRLARTGVGSSRSSWPRGEGGCAAQGAPDYEVRLSTGSGWVCSARRAQAELKRIWPSGGKSGGSRTARKPSKLRAPSLSRCSTGPVVESLQTTAAGHDPEDLRDLHHGVVVFGGRSPSAEHMFQPDPVGSSGY